MCIRDSQDIKDFRQLESVTPGHPESHITTGIETTTGPLGQGVATSVGMAVAGLWKKATYGEELFDYDVYVVAGDGDMMEGVAGEACALAGHLRLGKLIVLYDDNKVTLAGSAALSSTENIEQRFKAYGWQVLKVADGNDVAAIDKAIKKAKREAEKPSLICIASTIGYGAPCKQGSCDTHGSPLGADELQKVIGVTASLHLKDTDGGYHSENFPVLGEGIVKFERIRDLLVEAGYAGIDLGPVGYLGRGDALRERLAPRSLGLAGGYIELPFADHDALAGKLVKAS